MKIFNNIVLLSFLFYGISPLLQEMKYADLFENNFISQIHVQDDSHAMHSCCSAVTNQAMETDESIQNSHMTDLHDEDSKENGNCCCPEHEDDMNHHHCKCHHGAVIAYQVARTNVTPITASSEELKIGSIANYTFNLPDVIWHPPQIA